MQMTNREGFALPMAILVIGFMTAGVVASFTRVGAEIQTADNVRGQTAAFAMAEAGLAQFTTSGSMPMASLTATTTYTYPGGSATVTARRLHRVGNSSLVLLSSVGTATSPAGRPMARRTVAQFVRQEPLQMQVLSSWTSLSGISKQGNSGEFDGNDAAGSACGDGVARAGIAVPNGLATSTGNNQHIVNNSHGDPKIDYMGSKQEAADAIQIDWAGLINPAGPAVAPHNIRCASSTSTGFVAGLGPCPGSWPTNFDNFPTIIINGSMELPSSGKGLLIVTGNLTLKGGDTWDGVILVGGKITDNGQGRVSGSVVSGLNMTLGATVEESDVVDLSDANGTKRYEFDSCKVQSALAGASSGFQPIQNAWVDNWAAW